MNVHKNLTIPELFKHAELGGDKISSGILFTYTGNYRGRCPKAKRIVRDSLTKDKVDWNNNNEISKSDFKKLLEKFIDYKTSKLGLFLQEVSAVRDSDYSLNINIWTEYAKHSVFAKNMFVPNNKKDFTAHYSIYHFPSLLEEPTVVISFEQRVILISGTLYSGEIKKSIFTVLNYLFPEAYGFLPMHCSVNTDISGNNPAIFFGLSGTGKTTLSSDENRTLIGDDEHGWTDKGLVNFEGGCYAKTIRLSKIAEPQIWKACHTPGAILENVVINNNIPDFDDSNLTENTRASYPTGFIENACRKGYIDQHPKNIIMLTCDSFGVLPPVAKLSPEEAVQQFLLGYTAKVAGTEAGVTEPQATFSPCFGLPFMPLPPKKYGALLKEKILRYNVNCWLVNTGWTGGGYGIGKRMPISVTRTIIDHIHNGNLAASETFIHEYTGLSVPTIDSDLIPANILRPDIGWSDNGLHEEDYNKAASKLMKLFQRELIKQ